MDRETAKAIGRLSEKINDLGYRLDQYFNMKHDDNAANIDYLAMMSDVDFPSTDDITGGEA